ncbi:Odorant receptor 119 [Blattella germanica]|nr:Odorant receptor 119 [Blattella germanica]
MKKGSDSLNTSIREGSCELDLMNLQQKCLILAAIEPSNEIKINFWKSILFRIYQIIIVSTYIPLLVIQIFGCYHYRYDFLTLLDGIVPIGLASIGFFVPLSANWKIATELVRKFERDSVFIKAINQNNTKNINLLNEAQRFTKFLTCTLLVCITLSAGIWFTQPHIFAVLESFTNKKENSNSTIIMDPLKMYPLVIWIPYVDITATIPYMFISTLIGTCIFIVSTRGATFISYSVSIMIYTTTQFKMVATCMNEIDNVDDNELEFTDNNIISNNNGLSKQVLNCPNNKSPDELKRTHEEHLDDVKKQIKRKKFNVYKNIKLQDFEYEKCLLCPEEDEVKAITQLINSVKDHQQILKIINEVNDAFSSMFFMTIMLGALSLSLALFVVAVNPDFSNKLKNASAVMVLLIYGWIIFSNGEDVKEEGIKIHHTAYNLQWFKHSTKFKKILQIIIMRSQKPCGIMLGPLMDMTIENYSNILNTAYSYFTLLVQFESKDSEK